MKFNCNIFMLSSLILTALIGTSCCTVNEDLSEIEPTSEEAKAYWYDGKAEISSYTLEQARYGEIHEGNAVMIFVTEPFSKESWTKADNPGEEAIPVLKLNFTKKFNTGIYPYSMMTSSFFPFDQGKHAVKISTSLQEWCGHTFMEMKNLKKFEVIVNSYFEGESKEKVLLDKTYLEDDFWTIMRLNPKNLPTGTTQVIPSFFYLRLTHEPLKAYTCQLSINSDGAINTYSLIYPTINRELKIQFESAFPHKILSWEERYMSGYGANRKELVTTGKLKESIRVAYWNKNKVSDIKYRQQLGLD